MLNATEGGGFWRQITVGCRSVHMAAEEARENRTWWWLKRKNSVEGVLLAM